MAEYRDVSAALNKAIEERRFVISRRDMLNDEFVFRTVYSDLADFLMNLPKADVVEVVRCEDCVNLRASADGYSFCAKWDVDSYEEAMVRFDDFCSYGERRGG